MTGREFSVSGVEGAQGYPGIGTTPILKAFPDLEVGSVVKIHRSGLRKGRALTFGESLEVVVLPPAAGRQELRIAVAEELESLADYQAGDAHAEGAMDVTVLEVTQGVVTFEVTEIHQTGER